MAISDAELLVERLRQHSRDLISGGANATELRKDLLSAALEIERMRERQRLSGIVAVDDPGVTSQSILSDCISESTIARMAGNLLSGVFNEADYDRMVRHGISLPTIVGAVRVARAIAAEVERTKAS